MIDGVERGLSTHWIDHVRKVGDYAIALEIEWNNKDPFFDRDLENFKRLHIDAAISVGMIITRGKSLQEGLVSLVESYCSLKGVTCPDDLGQHGITRTERQSRELARRMMGETAFSTAFAQKFVQDKFGSSTTHWEKLAERTRRGAGGSCPLVLFGIPLQVVTGL